MIRTARTRPASVFRAVVATALVAGTLALTSSPPVATAATSDLLISEYVEGSSNNKAIEIYNGTGAAIDLAAGGYSIEMYFNGNVSAGLTVNLAGTVADGDVFVLAQSTADPLILAQADQTSGAGFFNGDDAIVLRKGAAVVDSLGEVGFDPGSEWGSGLVSTQDNTLRRMASVCAGDTVVNDVFDPVIEWDGFANNTFDGLGAHIANCGGPLLTDLLISEYVEGSSNNKAIEIYNGTGAAIDLAAGGYSIEMYFNGNVSAGLTVNLAGTVADGDVFVLAQSTADPLILAQADQTSGAGFFNGDDAIVLRKGAAVVDSLGEVGFDPGSEWGSGLVSTQDNTLRRMASVCAGDTVVNDVFDPVIEWDGFANNTFDGLGAHIANCGGGGGAAIIIDCGPSLVTDAGVAGSATVSASDADDTVDAMTLASDDVSPGGNLTGTFTPSAGVGDPATLELDLDALADVGFYTATVVAENSTGDTTTCDLQIQVVGITLIHDVQGPGLVSPIVGATVVVEGIVVGDFQNGAAGANGDLNGFHVQEEDADADTDPLTSEGIFVFDGSSSSSPAVDVAIGDLVRVEGLVSEFNGLTEITSFTGVTVLSSENNPPPPLPTPAAPSLPVTSVDDFERYEGMSVVFSQDLVISEYFNFDRFGEIVLTTDRRLTPTAEFEPGPAAIAAAADFLLNRITLDDGRTSQNPDPAIHPNGADFDLNNLFRGGDTVAKVTGVMDYGFGLYRIQPTQGADYTNANPRTAAPDPVGGDITVASFNVLNYFTTIDDGVNDICGPNGDQECRGADDPNELKRQRDKIVAALAAIDADVFGLIEIENNDLAGVNVDAVGNLVDSLNAATAPGTYDAIDTGTIGTDAIKVAMIYKPTSVSPVGPYAILDSGVDPRFIDTKSRPVLAQTFADNATGGVVTVAVNHLKSKGSACVDVGDPDTGDGSGNCNITRTMAAEALVDWLATDPTGSGDADFLIIGDLNSYDKEPPIDAIIAGGDDTVGTSDDYTDLVFQYLGEDAYSYVFDGQTGYLDHALANADLVDQVTGVTIWHINADEADLIDYDTSFKQPAQDAIYAPDAYRSSDHDPVIIGLELGVTETARGLKEAARADLEALLPTGSSKDDKAIEKAIDAIDDSLDPDRWLDDSYLNGKDGNKVFDEEKKAVKELDKVTGSAAAAAQAAIDQLLAADDLLANAALDIAINTGGKASDIAKAQSELAKAADEIADGDFDKAIDHYKKAWQHAVKAVEDARYATFNASLNRFNEGDLAFELATAGSAQPATIAEIIQRARPEVLLINEFDYDAGGVGAARFQQNYLSIGQGGADPIDYPFRYVAPSNTGIPSGFDLNNDGNIGGPDDAFGFGFFPGQFGMVVYSMHPIDVDEIRTFQNFLWKDMPGALLPEDPPGTPWFTPDELDVVRLSSKSHWDVPMWIGDREVHFLVSHPTPPVFDGPEDRNGKRNFDEIRFWADYVKGGGTACVHLRRRRRLRRARGR